MSPDCNHTSRTVFGGKVMAEIDRLAFVEVLRWLESEKSICDEAVTYLVDKIVFHAPAYLGDVVYLDAKVLDNGAKSVTVEVKGKVWRKEDRKTIQFCEAKLVFVTKYEGKPHKIHDNL